MLHQPYKVVATLLDKMVETNKESQKKYEWEKLVAQVDVLSKRVTELKSKPGRRKRTSPFESANRERGMRLQDTQITHMMTGHYPPFAEDSLNYTMGDSEDEE
uniref:Uncharacterized protein n=1 Tax=Solanum tuberosum TaxID=4113 RepID=M1DHY8_SOLTU